MPESFATRWGSNPASHAAWMMPPVMALWPQPGHSVVLLPSYSALVRPSRLTGWPAGAVVLTLCFLPAIGRNELPSGSLDHPLRHALVRQHAADDRARIQRQAVVVEHAADARGAVRRLEPDALGQLPVAVLLDHVDAVVLLHELGDARGQRHPADAHIRG